MINKEVEFKNKYIDFLKTNQDSEIIENLKILENFKKDFPIDKLQNIALDEYVIGKQNEYGETNKESFCYRLERGDTSVLGSIRGGTAVKFGVYYSKDLKEYRFTNKFEDKDDAIDRIGTFLYNLARLENFSEIYNLKDNYLSPMVIRKVFYMYHSEKIIPIFLQNLY